MDCGKEESWRGCGAAKGGDAHAARKRTQPQPNRRQPQQRPPKNANAPAAFFSSTAAGGVLSTNVKLRSSYTVISTGMMSPAILAVAALYSLQNAMMLTPCVVDGCGVCVGCVCVLRVFRCCFVAATAAAMAPLPPQQQNCLRFRRTARARAHRRHATAAAAPRSRWHCVVHCADAAKQQQQRSVHTHRTTRCAAPSTATAAAPRHAAHLGTERGADRGSGVGLARLQLQLNLARHCDWGLNARRVRRGAMRT